MNHSEACNILGVEKSATKEDINSKFRKFAKENHPDINKAPGAEAKYKQTSEAYEYLKNYDPSKENNPFGAAGHQGASPFGGFGGMGFNDAFFRDFMQNNVAQSIPNTNNKEHIFTSVDLSFKDSVLGCERTITVDRKVRCSCCQGKTTKSTDKTCSACGGSGIANKTHVNGNLMFQQRGPCDKCFQSGKEQEPCDKCNKTGQEDKKSEFTVRIPEGLTDGHTLTLSGAGHFIPFGQRYVQGNVFIRTTVEKDPNMTLQENDVISHLNISLYEALIGVTKDVRTIDGHETITVEPRIKNKDSIIIKNKGLRREGNQVVVVDIDYPEDVSKLIEVLKPEVVIDKKE